MKTYRPVSRSPITSLLAVSLVVSLIGCSVTEKPTPGRRVKPRQERDVSEAAVAEAMPWEIWQPFYDLRGEKLSNASLLLGDEYLRKGKRRSALDAYLKALGTKLSDNEGEAAALRASSQYLALDESARALSTVSKYFKNRGLAEADVSTPFSLLLAYAYGRHGDREQALAWFSKANRQAQRGEATGIGASRSGASKLLTIIPDAEFETVALDWNSDPFIRELVGLERARRNSPGYRGDAIDLRTPFWDLSTIGVAVAQAPSAEAPREGQPVTVGLMLSLSDKFGSLGRDTKQGFELAVQADTGSPKIKVETRDVGVDASAASTAVRELAAAAKPSVIVGPLLSDAATSAAQTAREVRVPLLSFSKSETFDVGGDITRLGATTTSQVEAIVTAAHKDFGLTQFAVAYPQSASGQEFLTIFKKKLSTFGLTPVLEAPYAASDEASLLEVAQRLDAASAQALLIPDSLEVSGKILSNLSPAVRKKLRPLGTALWDNPSKIANSQALFNGAIFVTPFFAQSERPVVRQFTDSYKGRYKTAPNFLAAQGFDAGTIVVAALRRAAQDNVSFSEALSKLPPYEGVTGAISFDRGTGIRRAFYVVEVSPAGFAEKFPGASPAPALTSSSATLTNSGSSLMKDDERVESGY